MDTRAATEPLRLAESGGRWVLAASVLGSGAAFVEGTVVNVALPALGRDLGIGIAGLQWVMDGYLLTLSALMLLGGSLGDVLGRRRVFAWGALAFAASSTLAALSPSAAVLVAVRLVQGVAGALLVPNSLAMLSALFADEDRGAAIGRWAGWSGVSTALGPLVGGWLVEAASWRWVFAVVVPFSLAAAWLAWRKVPSGEKRNERSRSIDWAGAALATLGLGGLLVLLVSGPTAGAASPIPWVAGLGGAAALLAFVAVERQARDPLLPLSMFRSRQFTGANVATLLVYAAVTGLFFLLMLQLQNAMGYGALVAGLSLLPINVLLLVLSPVAGRIAERIGPRWPMTLGCLVAALGLALLTRVRPGASYVADILPALCVFGLGLGTLVAPLTAAVLGAAPASRIGTASGVNNTIARLAGLLAVVALPLAAGLSGLGEPTGPALVAGYVRAMWISAASCVVAGAVAFATVKGRFPTPKLLHPSTTQGCIPPGE